MNQDYSIVPDGADLAQDFYHLDAEHGKSNHELAPSRFQKGLSAVNLSKNRYTDIIPLDETLLELDLGEYLNANWVRDEEGVVHYAPQPFIMTQAPTNETMSAFFRAIWTQKIAILVCLTPLVECGRVKATRYWPMSVDVPMTIANTWSVKLVEEMPLCRGLIVRRVMRLRKLMESSTASPDAELTFTMYHYLAWCDNASPTCLESCAELLRLVREDADAEENRNKPILVHCSAGVGRAGTFVAAYNLILIRDRLLTPVSLKEMVDWLRKQRYGAVQSLAQYRFIPQIYALFDANNSSASDSLSTSTASSDEGAEEEYCWLTTCQVPLRVK